MRIAFINGSPKIKESTSGMLLEDIKNYVFQQAECIDIAMHSPKLLDADLQQFKSIDTFVISCPLYVDGIPGHLLSCLGQLEEVCKNQSQINVYGIVNCGFYEGEQAKYALNILENWCVKTGMIWSGGIGIGGGGGLSQMPHGPRIPIDKAFQEMGNNMMQKQIQKNQYISIAFPRFLYKIAAQFGWRQLIKANGGKAKDLNIQW